MNVSLAGFVAVGVGAALGAWSRLGLTIWLNHRHPNFPLGTFAANVIGGLLVGMALAYIGRYPEWSPVWRMFVITGLLGGLTIFSTFSAEVVTLIERGNVAWALVVGGGHLFTSLILTVVGIILVRAFPRT